MIDPTKYNDAAKYPAYSKIQANFGYFLKKIVKDNQISDSEKVKCLENI